MKRFLRITLKILAGLVLVILLFSLVMYIATNGNYSVPETVAQDPTIPHVEIDNVVFHAETFGEKGNKVVIVIHGGPGNDFRYLLPLKALSDDYFVVFYDQRGTGLSPRVDDSEQSLENSLNDLANIIDYYSPNEKVNIIGHSWGGMLASGYIARHPDRADKVVLAEPGFLTTEQAQEFNSKFKLELSWDVLKGLTEIAFESLHVDAVDDQSRLDYMFGRLVSLNVKENPMGKYFCNEDVSTGYIPFWRFGAIASQGIQNKAIDENGEFHIDLVSGVENFKNKVLFIAGGCNQLIGEVYQKEHMKYFPNAEMVVIPDAGHSMLGEKPEESMRIIRTYFEEE